MCVCALAHPVTSSQLYLHLLNKALCCLTDMTRLARCNIRSASWLLYICWCRCHLQSADCCCRALGYSLLGCCGSNRRLCCGNSGYLLISFRDWQSGYRLCSHFNLVRLDRQPLGDVHECGFMPICTQFHQSPWWCMGHDWLHVLQWQGATVSCHCLLQKQSVLQIVEFSCGNL